MPPILSSLLQHTRVGILLLLLVVLPLQSVVQLVAGVQGRSHVHTGTAPAAPTPSLLRALLHQLHAAQDSRLQAGKLSWVLNKGPLAEMHEHGGVFHSHAHDEPDVLDVGDSADDSLQGGVTAFLAWLPVALALPADAGSDRPAMATRDWRDRVVAPPLMPPRG